MDSRQCSSSSTRDAARAGSRAEGVDDAELRPPVGSVFDTDALDRAGERADEAARASFCDREWTVDVRGDDRIAVSPVPDDE